MTTRKLLVCIALGFGLVAGCKDKKSKATTATNEAAPKPAAPTSAAGSGRHAVGGYSAVFPKKPELKTKTLANGTLEALSVEGDDGNVYGLMVTQYTVKLDPQTALGSLKASAFGSIKQKTVTEKPIEKFGFPGREISFVAAQPLGGTKRTYIDGARNRMIEIQVVANDKLEAAVVRAFLDSLQAAAK